MLCIWQYTNMFRRHLGSYLAEAARRMPVVTLTGPRQSGKTTLVRSVFPDHSYVSLERPDLRAHALEDPRGFLGEHSGGVIFDEVQRAPDLLSYLQGLVDENPRSGRFILTGSQNLLLQQKVSQTLAGRTAVMHLLPLSLSELCGHAPLDPDQLDQLPPPPSPAPPIDRGLWETVWAGFYPRIHDQNLPPSEWLAGYQQTYVEKDLRDILHVMDLDGFQRFMRLVAGRSGQELNLEALAADAGITRPTARSWLTALRIGFLVTLLQPHRASFRKRLRKRPRLHFLDTGLLCYLLGIRDPATLEHHPLRGAIFETFVVGEITKAFVHAGREAPLYLWRDTAGHEIDILIDLGTRLVPVEVRSGLTLSSAAWNGLRWWTTIPGNPNHSGTLVHGGTEFSMHGSFVVRPWHLS